MPVLVEMQKSVPNRVRDFLSGSDLIKVEYTEKIATTPFPHASHVNFGIAPKTPMRNRNELSELAMSVMRQIPGGELYYETRNDEEHLGIPRIRYVEDLGGRKEVIHTFIRDRETLELNLKLNKEKETRNEWPRLIFDKDGDCIRRWEDPATRTTIITVYPRDIIAKIKPLGMCLSENETAIWIPEFDFGTKPLERAKAADSTPDTACLRS